MLTTTYYGFLSWYTPEFRFGRLVRLGGLVRIRDLGFRV